MIVFHNIKSIIAKLIALPSRPRIFGLDFMRAIAILAVIVTHIQFILPSYIVDVVQKYSVPGATIGVEIFFVLSGFLIGSVLLSLELKFNEVSSLLYFWQRRWFRTLPNYYLFLAITTLQFTFLALPLPNLLNYLTFTQNWFWQQPNFFKQSWSLAIEEWFYLLFPVTLFLIYRVSKSFTRAFLFSAAIFIIIPILLRIQWVNIEGNNSWGADFRQITLIRLDAIMYGVLMAWIRKRFLFEWCKLRFIFFFVGLAILLFIWILIGQKELNISFFAKEFFSFLLSLGISFTLPMFDQWEISKESPVTHTIRLIALWSYSLYLSNLPIIQIVINIKNLNPQYTSSLEWNIFFLVLAFISMLIVSSIVYTYFEKPITGLRERFSKASDKSNAISVKETA